MKTLSEKIPDADDLDTGHISHTDTSYGKIIYLVPEDERSGSEAHFDITVVIGSGTTRGAAEGRWLAIACYGPGVIGESVEAWLKEHAEIWDKIADSYLGSEWDGNNLRGQWAEDCPKIPEDDEFDTYWSAEEWNGASPKWSDISSVELKLGLSDQEIDALVETTANNLLPDGSDGMRVHKGDMEKAVRCRLDEALAELRDELDEE